MRMVEASTSHLVIRDLVVGYGGTTVLPGLSLSVASGEMAALLGASGCGKTTLLRAIGGFLEVRAGAISVNGKTITSSAPEHRDMAMVFQSYALWPHMSVRQNVGYGLKLRAIPKAEVRRKVDHILEMLGLSAFSERSVTALSGGQRQRVALGRALAIEPSILLLDEPLSNLDAKIRHQVRHDLRAIQQRLGITSILVTHDREEAMVLADKIVVMEAGTIAQIGTPEEVFNHPVTAFVADFMGADNEIILDVARMNNEWQAREVETGVVTALPDGTVNTPGKWRALFRAEAASLHPLETPLSHGLSLPGQILQRTYPGGQYRYVVSFGTSSLLVNDPHRYEIGQAIGLLVPFSALHLFTCPSVSEHSEPKVLSPLSTTDQESSICALPA